MADNDVEKQFDANRAFDDEKTGQVDDVKKRKEFPFWNPTRWTTRINIMKTIYGFFSLFLTLATFHFYYIAVSVPSLIPALTLMVKRHFLTFTLVLFLPLKTFREGEVSKKLFIIILACELVPRIIQVILLHKFTSPDDGFHYQDGFGVFLCKFLIYCLQESFTYCYSHDFIFFNVGGSSYYFWRGKDREKLTRKHVDKLRYTMDGLQVIKFILIIYVLVVQEDQPRSADDEANNKVLDKLSSAGSTLLILLLITALLYIIRFLVFLVKKLLTCCGCRKSK